jgi:hypothetical protein
MSDANCSRSQNFSGGTEREGAMFAEIYRPDVFFTYQSMGLDHLVGAAADIVNVLMVLFVAVVSVTSLSPDMPSEL